MVALTSVKLILIITVAFVFVSLGDKCHKNKNRNIWQPIPGSKKKLAEGSTVVGKTSLTLTINITIVLRGIHGVEDRIKEIWNCKHVHERKHLTLTQIGSHPDDVGEVLNFTKKFNLTLIEINKSGRIIKVSGTVSQINKAFRVTLTDYYSPTKGNYHGHQGPIYVPSNLIGIIVSVLGLDNRPFAKRKTLLSTNTVSSILPNQAPTIYNFPTNADGSGQCVAIIELGGGYYPNDNMYPNLVSWVSVDGATNSPSNNFGIYDGEVALDIQVVQGVAPGAKIVVYFAPNTDSGFVDVLVAAYTGTSHCGNSKLSAISLSWGGSEGNSLSNNAGFESGLNSASALGIVVAVSSGDTGANDVEYPASSSNALACGGTSVTSTSPLQESCWDHSSGGVSKLYAKPSYQSSIPNSKASKRAIPDVSSNSDPGYTIKYNGVYQYNVDGTSSAAPLWAGLVAVMSQKIGKNLGPINPLLYSVSSSSGAFNDITTGSNGSPATSGWDECTGLGTPNGLKLLAALQGPFPPSSSPPPPPPSPPTSTKPPSSPPTTSTCSHSYCSSGAILNSNCDPCVKKVCTYDPYCCNTKWDSICVGEVVSICGITC